MASVQHQPAEVNVGQTHGPAAVWLYQQGVLFQFRLLSPAKCNDLHFFFDTQSSRQSVLIISHNPKEFHRHTPLLSPTSDKEVAAEERLSGSQPKPQGMKRTFLFLQKWTKPEIISPVNKRPNQCDPVLAGQCSCCLLKLVCFNTSSLPSVESRYYFQNTGPEL